MAKCLWLSVILWFIVVAVKSQNQLSGGNYMEKNKRNYLVIDNHSHVTIPIEQHVKLMNEAGIDKTILFRTLVHPEKEHTAEGIKKEMGNLNAILSGNPDLAAKKSVGAAKELEEAIKRYPDRFIGFGNVPLGLTETEMIEYIRVEITGKGFVGIGEFTLGSGQIPMLETVFSASSQSGNLPLWIHAFNPLTLHDIKEIEILGRKYPSVPVIIGHMGGSNWLETIDIIKANDNLYLDTSAAFSTLALRIVLEELPDKALFGVDYPYGDMLLAKQTIERVCKDEGVLRKVLGGNILKLVNCK